MRYIIIGAGAIGGVIGARLAQHSEHPPLLIARGEHGRAIQSAGLRLRTPNEDTTVQVDAVFGPDDVALATDDVLVFATKTHQVEAALLEWVDQPVFDAAGERVGTVGDLLPALMVLNGIESERLALRLFRRVFAVCIKMPGLHLTPGEVIVRMAPTSGIFFIGRYAAEADEADRELLATIDRDWNASTLEVHVVDDVMRWKYLKLLSNLSNALQALVGPRGDYAAIGAALRREARGVYAAAGIEAATAEEERAIVGEDWAPQSVPGVPAEVGGSSWQSVARGSGSIETDYLNGEIVYIGRTVGLPTPLNATVQRLARQLARSGGGAGQMTVPQLETELGL